MKAASSFLTILALVLDEFVCIGCFGHCRGWEYACILWFDDLGELESAVLLWIMHDYLVIQVGVALISVNGRILINHSVCLNVHASLQHHIPVASLLLFENGSAEGWHRLFSAWDFFHVFVMVEREVRVEESARLTKEIHAVTCLFLSEPAFSLYEPWVEHVCVEWALTIDFVPTTCDKVCFNSEVRGDGVAHLLADFHHVFLLKVGYFLEILVWISRSCVFYFFLCDVHLLFYV